MAGDVTVQVVIYSKLISKITQDLRIDLSHQTKYNIYEVVEKNCIL